MGRPSQGWALKSLGQGLGCYLSHFHGDDKFHLGVLFTNHAAVRRQGMSSYPVVDEGYEVTCSGQGRGVGEWLIWNPQQGLLAASPGLILTPCDAFCGVRRLGTPWHLHPGNRDNLLL